LLSVGSGLTLAGGARLLMEGGSHTASIEFFGTQTLGGDGEVVFEGTSQNNFLTTIGGGSPGTEATLTIAGGITIHGPQGGTIYSFLANDTIINQGTILADAATTTITATGVPFVNEGSISASLGTIILDGDWSNPTGRLNLSGSGTFNLAGTFTPASIGTLNRSGGTINVTGFLDLSDEPLALNATTGSFQLLGGSIENGTVTAADGTGLAVPAFSAGFLDAVTLASDIQLQDGAALFVTDGLALSGGAKVIFAGDIGGALHFNGTQTLAGNGEVIFGGTANSHAIFSQGDGTQSSAAILTIGPGITVRGSQSGFIGGSLDFDGVINQGTIIAEGAGNSILLEDFGQTSGELRLAGGSFNATSTVFLEGGELTGAGVFSGTLQNDGGQVRPSGRITISGAYTQGNSGALIMEIGGTTPGVQYDQLEVIGDATVGGLLSVDLIGGFIPSSSDVFDVVVTTTGHGAFATVDLPPELNLHYTATTVQLTSGTFGTPLITINDVSVIEGDDVIDSATFTITLSEPSTQPVSVFYETGIGTASFSDYVGLSPILLTFNPGETSKTISVDIIDDSLIEGSETFFIDLRNPTNAVISDAQGVGTILDDDAPIVIAPNGKQVTLTDVDGDEITIKTTRGALTAANFVFAADGSLQMIDLLNDVSFRGANLVIDAEAVGGGDGLVNVGMVNATSLNLGKVAVSGTLGQIMAGDGDGKTSAVKSLSIGSLGTNAIVTEPLVSEIRGGLGKLNIASDVRGAAVTVQGKLKKVTVGGDLVGDTGGGAALLATLPNGGSGVAAAGTGGIPVGAFTAGSVGSFNVKGNMNGGSVGADGDIGSVNVGNDFNGGAIAAGGQVQVVKVLGKLKSDDPTAPAVVAALARLGSTKAAGSVAIDRLEIRGDVENAQILLGYKKEDLNGQTVYNGKNPDASSGKVIIGGDWIASSLVAGVFDATADGFGQNDSIIEGDVTTRIVARIASVVIKGNAIGTAAAGDHFGIVAQEVGKLSIAGANIELNKASKDDILLDEANGDFRILEV